MKKMYLNIMLTAVFTILMFCCINVSAADCYSFSYQNFKEGTLTYKFYSHNSSTNTYTCKREFYLRGSQLYTKSNKLISSNLMGSGTLYVGFDKDGDFYFITKESELVRYSSGKKNVISSKAIRLNRDSNDLVISVKTYNGTYSISNPKTIQKVTYKNKTLSLIGKNLYYNNKKIASGVSDFGFMSPKKIVYIKKSRVYIKEIKQLNRVTYWGISKAKKLKQNLRGFSIAVILKNSKQVAL